MTKGFLLIECDPIKSSDKFNPWRTGNQWVITHEAANRMFNDTTKGAAFIEIDDATKIGLYK
jgi:hypothetical protein